MMIRSAESVKRLFRQYIVTEYRKIECDDKTIHFFRLTQAWETSMPVTCTFNVFIRPQWENDPKMRKYFLHCKAIVEALLSLPRI